MENYKESLLFNIYSVKRGRKKHYFIEKYSPDYGWDNIVRSGNRTNFKTLGSIAKRISKISKKDFLEQKLVFNNMPLCIRDSKLENNLYDIDFSLSDREKELILKNLKRYSNKAN